MEGFQSSLRDALGIRDSLENSARMVERLTSVINVRSAALDAALAERDEARDRTISGLVAADTLIALPPTCWPSSASTAPTWTRSARSSTSAPTAWPIRRPGCPSSSSW